MGRKDRQAGASDKISDRWPVTYRWMAMGTLVAYSALGATKLAAGCPVGENFPSEKNTNGQQALLVRRFTIVAGSLEVTLDAFAKVTGIRVNFADDRLKKLPSKGVTGLYAPERALACRSGGIPANAKRNCSQRARSASTASAARRPLIIAPLMEALSR